MDHLPDRILVVEDVDPNLKDISSALINAGYKVQAAASSQALSILESSAECELMIIDVRLADAALLQKSREMHPDLPVVVFTSVQDSSTAFRALQDGAYDYILKPFAPEQLFAVVRRSLEFGRLQRNTRTLTLELQAYQKRVESLVTPRTEQLRRQVEQLRREIHEPGRTLGDLERSYDITLEAIGEALDLKESGTIGHSKQVTAFTIAIARAIGIEIETIRVMARAAFLHDIGQITVPDSILRKPGPLTPEETAAMRKHCACGYHLLRKIPFLVEAAEIVYAHHEAFDGNGYPRGLRGEEIPLGARIFAVADALDAIISVRPYRAAQSIEVARKSIQLCSGRQFDPKVVEVFLQMPQSIWTDLRRDIDGQVYRFNKDK